MTESQPFVVVVEDDASLRHALLRLLNAAGYCSRAFDSAEALLGARLEARVDCFVLDIRLPGQSGLTLYGSLHGPRPPAIFISADDGEAQRRAVAQSGADALLLKPFAGTALLAAVARAMDRAAPRRADG
jgi:FixJ family two-component response regulator